MNGNHIKKGIFASRVGGGEQKNFGFLPIRGKALIYLAAAEKFISTLIWFGRRSLEEMMLISSDVLIENSGRQLLPNKSRKRFELSDF